MRDRAPLPSVADSDLAVTDKMQASYELQNTDNTLISSGNPYPVFTPDYKAKPFAGMRRFFRFTIPPQNERESPSELQILKIGLQNPLGTVYTATPTGKTVPISFFVPNPAGMRYREGPVGNASPEPPEINQGGAKAYLNIVNSVVRRR